MALILLTSGIFKLWWTSARQKLTSALYKLR